LIVWCCVLPQFFCLTYISDDLRAEQDRNKMLQEDMEATLQDIQNIWIGTWERKVQGHFWWIGSNIRRDVWLLKYLSTFSSHHYVLSNLYYNSYRPSTLDFSSDLQASFSSFHFFILQQIKLCCNLIMT
jgi:hypothetical protein